jgi:hypothetical protein
MVKTVGLANYSDVYYTPDEIAHKIVMHFSPTGKCLEPFCGNNAFLKFLPEQSDWCEITKGRNFFDFNKPVDWIVTNPPFSNLTQVFEHSFRISNNCVFLVPISKYWSSNPRLKLAREYGGLKEILHVGTGRQIGFDIGFPFAALHFAKGYSGTIRETGLIE